jgi:phosphoribosylformimino-5-aminoimidazole carboxamide ribonucleotide (ProFAR) isomerase
LVGEVRGSNSTIPIGAGNSVRSTKDVDSFFDAGADFVFLGTMANFRPWAVGSTIDYINAYEVRRHAA